MARVAVRSARRWRAGATRSGSTASANVEPQAESDTEQYEASGAVGGGHVAYMMSRFPKISETFILDEILELRRRGVRVDLYPLLRERQPVAHPEAEALTGEARFQPFVPLRILASHLRVLARHPRVYVRTVWHVLSGTARSMNFFVGAVGILPKVVHMARLMERDGVQHAHCHFATHPALAGLIVRRLTGIPFSFAAHGSDLHVDRRMLADKVAEAAFVVAISEYNRDVILEGCRPEDHDKVHVIHCGVDLDQFRNAALSTPSDELRILCVGTLHEVKDQGHLVDAVALLQDRGVAAACRFVGDGPDRQALEERARRAGVADRARFLRSLPRDSVIEALDWSDVLVAPSVPTAQGKREGIPVVLMEAMAMQRPVVASRLSGIPELVADGRSGLLVPPGDATALADALEAIAGDAELRRRLGREGRRTVEDGFSLPRSVADLCGLMGVE